ncbi:acylphosphatase [Aquibaculum arenosum]|uniref:acylphosphatase n=1 Tax=Aquibaculum arenosum TaxID=3032591 RepID=A0ABT5YQM7_9PROT|nr:acylphosphatase [Fodinicurvata sp. CAU 1616]MDF2097273.1 acylphosphatase [Fodinicurvata sp. CAU 1616]
MAKRQVRVVISGKVQGVWYRAWTREQAERRSLDGWVRNRRDGTVEAVFSGSAEAVESMLTACRAGPARAVVDDVAVSAWDEAVEPGFRQLPTV